MMEAAAMALGAALVSLVGLDLMLTVLHPTREGPISGLATRAGWRAVRAVSQASGKSALMGFAGPAAMSCQFATWALGVWTGFALIYSARLGDLSFSPDVAFGAPDVVDALYLSAVALTTVGFGDVVAGTDELRLVTTLEAASGLAVITGAITYLLSVYPLVSQVRVAARSVARAAASDREAHMFVVNGGRRELVALRDDLIQIDEDTQRFPVLYHFHSEDSAASLSTLVRAASLVTMQLRWGPDEHRAPYDRWYGEALDEALSHAISHYRRTFIGTISTECDRRSDPKARLQRLSAVGDATLPSEDRTAAEVAEFAAFYARCDAFLAALGARHAYPYEPL